MLLAEGAADLRPGAARLRVSALHPRLTKRPGTSRPPADRYRLLSLRLDYRDDLMGTRIDHDDFVADQDVFVAAPLRIDCEYSLRQRV
jgi:hypothetical protein